MKKLVAALLLLVLCAVAWPQTSAPAPDSRRVFVQIEQILAELGTITGLKPLRPIRHDLINKDGVRRFLEERIREEIKPQELRAEELVLKKFGFVPADFDLKKTMVDLLTEQAAAFYDFRKKKMFVLESAPSMLQQVALVHEVAHALADQHFHLDKFVDSGNKSDDTATARQAVMEGQATWLMSEYMARRSGQSLRTSPAILDFMVASAAMPAGQFPVFDAAPLYLKETLLFPYAQGMLFQHALVEKMDRAGFAEVYRRPPVSSQQILHPDKYFAGVVPVEPATPELNTSSEYKELIAGAIGELDHKILLRQYASQSEADSLAPNWTGGRYRLLEHKKNKRVVLLYVSQWESEECARAFFRAYRRLLEKKWKRMEVRQETDRLVAGLGDDGHFLLSLDGSRISSLEGMASAAEAAVPPALN